MATIRQVAALAKVSVATVSRVLNDGANISSKARQAVEQAMAELDYKPNSVAKSLATNRTDSIGLVVSDLSGPFFGDMMFHVEQTVRDHGKHLVITSGHSSVNDEISAIEFLLERQCDALIVHADALSDADLLKLMEKTSTPMVLINRFVPEAAKNCVYLDNELGGYIATKHLIDLGHKKFACIAGPLRSSDARSRLMGFRKALSEAGLPFHETQVVEGEFTEQGGIDAIGRFVKREIEFTALVCGNDLMAIGAMKAMKADKKNFPHRVAVVGYDDVVMSSYVEPALTTVRVPVAEMGRQAAHLALNLCAQLNLAVSQTFKPELVERESATQPE